MKRTLQAAISLLVLAGAVAFLVNMFQPASGSGGASNVRLLAEYREWESAGWSDVRANWQYTIVDDSRYRSQETLTVTVDPGVAHTTVWSRIGNLAFQSATDSTAAIVDQRRAAWTVPVPEDIADAVANVVGVPVSRDTLGELTSMGVPVVDPAAIQQLIGQGVISVEGIDTILGESVNMIRIPGTAPGQSGEDMIVWLTADGIKMRQQHNFHNDPNLQVEVTSIDRTSTVMPNELVVPIDESRPLREAGSRSLDLTSIGNDYPYDGSVFMGDVRKVANPTSLVGLSGFSIGPAAFITATLPLQTLNNEQDFRSGWLVTHEIIGPSDKYVLVIQAPAGIRLPIDFAKYWPEDLAQDVDESVGQGSYYASKDEIMLKDFYIADLYEATPEEEIEPGREPLTFDNLLTTTIDTSIRCVLLGRNVTSEELSDIAEAFLPDHEL